MSMYQYLNARGNLLQRDEPRCGRPTWPRSRSWGGNIVALGVSPTDMTQKGEHDVAIGSLLGATLVMEPAELWVLKITVSPGGYSKNDPRMRVIRC